MRQEFPTTRSAALLFGLTLIVAACGGGDEEVLLPTLADASDETTVTTDQNRPEERSDGGNLAYERCLAEQGLEVAASEEEAREQVAELGDEAYDAALAECEPLLEGVFTDAELDPDQEAEELRIITFIQRCLADQGIEVEFDNPDFVPPLPDEEMEAAIDSCGPPPGFDDGSQDGENG